LLLFRSLTKNCCPSAELLVSWRAAEWAFAEAANVVTAPFMTDLRVISMAKLLFV
jgi:hypothetical protein